MSTEVVTLAIERLIAGESLDRAGAEVVLDAILEGEVDPVQIAAFLVALRAKGETAEEIAGLAAAVRRRATPVPTSRTAFVDTCGTGGGASTFNISTAVAIVVAGAGVAVAKHGNRSVTSRCGSADVLEALGVRVDLTPEAVGQCLDEVGLAFMFAPNHHPAFRHIGPVRTALGVRTVFNILGPLVNPAGATRQMIGVFDAAYLDRIAAALVELGAERAFVVAGRDGLDEISTSAPTDLVEVSAAGVTTHVIEPEALGIARPFDGVLRGGGPAENAEVIRQILSGGKGAARDIVTLNAGAVLWLADHATTIEAGVAAATGSIDSGAAEGALRTFVETTQRLAPGAG